VPRYLITGGAGFIGSNLAETLLRAGSDVRILDDFSTGRRENLAEAGNWAAEGGAAFDLVEGDIRDDACCRRAVEGADYVLHQAAMPSVPRSVQDPATSNAVNITGTLNLLLAARDAGVKRFVSASSSSVYGDTPTLPKEESMPTNPISPYALQKATGESYCILFHRLYGLETVALRYFNVFGPRQDPGSEYSAVIPKFITAIKNGERPVVFGDGGQTRDFTYVANVVQINLRACTAGPDALGKAYNVGTGERISLNDLLEALGELGGTRVEPDYRPPREGDVRHSLASIDRARTLLGYEVEIGLKEGLQRTWEHF
jgi:nucleoside-diphosphate-sugar epimerase